MLKVHRHHWSKSIECTNKIDEIGHILRMLDRSPGLIAQSFASQADCMHTESAISNGGRILIHLYQAILTHPVVASNPYATVTIDTHSPSDSKQSSFIYGNEQSSPCGSKHYSLI